jgi:hypothetical protein
MGALSSKYNENPKQASRAFDADRDGFVIKLIDITRLSECLVVV